MAEMMIAIIILGLGLLMVATMFPVAWTRARDLAEFTNHNTASQAAQTTVQMLCRVYNPAIGLSVSSFLGDTQIPTVIDADGTVHVLEIQNAFADPGMVTPGASYVPRGESFQSNFLVRASPLNTVQIDPKITTWLF